MKFTNSGKSKNYNIVKYVSENNIWEIGIFRVMFGYRVGISKTSNLYCRAVTYCCGADIGFTIKVLLLIAELLNTFNENITEEKLIKIFPVNYTKPIYNDNCWNDLQKMYEGKNIKKKH